MLFNSHSSAIQYKMPVGVKHSNLLTDQRGKHHSLLEVCLPEQGGQIKCTTADRHVVQLLATRKTSPPPDYWILLCPDL